MSHSTFVQCLNFPRETLISRLWCRSQPCTCPCPLSAAPDLWLSPPVSVATLSFLLSSPTQAVTGRSWPGPGWSGWAHGHQHGEYYYDLHQTTVSSKHSISTCLDVCLFNIKCFRFYDIAIILSRPPPVISMENLQFIELNLSSTFFYELNLVLWLWWCWHMMGTISCPS